MFRFKRTVVSAGLALALLAAPFGLFAGEIFRVIFLRALDLDGLLVARRQALQALLKVRQHLSLAEYDRNFLARAALELFTVNRAGEVDDNPVAVL